MISEAFVQGKKILVVDDEAHITGVLSLKLGNAGFDVTTAADGEEALEVVEQERPDMIITDLQMPYVSGIELAVRLGESEETASIPLLMLTARGYSLSDEDLAPTNIKEVLSKPFSPRDILERVKSMLGEQENRAA